MKIVVLDGYTENPGDLSWSALEQLGELVVTTLMAEAMPLIRFRTGQAVQLEEGLCECGRTLRRVATPFSFA